MSAKPTLTIDDLCRAAERLRCDIAAIRAVAHVESRGEGFYSNGFPTILFERHKFRAFTHGRFNVTHPHLSGPQGGYGTAGQNQRNKFNEAFRLAPEAAMMACSWGKFQVMGFNWDFLGYGSIHEFVDRMKISEGEHLEAFVRYVIKSGLQDEIQRLDFKTFARIYNGPLYRKNEYDTKMLAMYRKFKAENVDCGQLREKALVVPVITEPEIAGLVDGLGTDLTGQSETAVSYITPPTEPSKYPVEAANGTEMLSVSAPAAELQQDADELAAVTEPEPYNGIGFWATIKRDLVAVFGGNLGFESLATYVEKASGWPEWVVSIITKAAVGALVVSFGYLTFRVIHFLVDSWKKNQRTRTEAEANTAIDRRNIMWVPPAR